MTKASTLFAFCLFLLSHAANAGGTNTSTSTSAVSDYLNSISASTGTGTDSGSVLADQAILSAGASNTNTSTSTTMTYANTSIVGSGTNTATAIGTGTLDLGNISSGMSTDSGFNQQTAQQTYQKSSSGASQDAQIISLAAIAVGTVMLFNPHTHVPGEVLIGLGIAGEAVSMVMGSNADKASGNSTNLGSLIGTPTTKPSTALLPNQLDSSPSSISIDPSLLEQGKLGSVLSDFEAKSGVSRGELAAAVQSGANIPDLITKNMSPDQAEKVKAGIEGSMSDGSGLSSADILAKTGLTADDLKLKDKNSLQAGNVDGAGGARSPASKNGNDLQSIFGSGNEAKPTAGAATDTKKSTKISSELEAALRRNGLSNMSLFEIVHSQYVKQLPMMKGIQKKAETFDNPLEAKATAPGAGM